MRTSDKLLDALQRNGTITPDGRAWLTAAVDPFHDTDLDVAGYPDVMSASTVVQLVKQQITVAAPAIAGTGNWDCSIALFPNFLNQNINYSAILSNGTFIAPSSIAAANFGGLAIVTGSSGATLWPTAVATPTAGNAYIGLDPSAYTKGNCRVISAGFEIVNTTAEIYKQGQLTSWRMPYKASLQGYSFLPVGATTYVPKNALYMRSPPATVAAAQLLYGSRSWAAAEGAYVVARQNDTENPCTQPSYVPVQLCASDLIASFTTGANTYPVYAFAPIEAPNTVSDAVTPFDISGCHLTGLSNATTLTINVRWYIERLPSPLETDLVVLASPSAIYDPIALEMFSQAMSRAPPGVMLKENPLGEWFTKAMSAISNWAPKIGSALSSAGVPFAGALGNGIGGAANLANTVNESTRRKPTNTTKSKPKPLPQVPTRLLGSASGMANAGTSNRV